MSALFQGFQFRNRYRKLNCQSRQLSGPKPTHFIFSIRIKMSRRCHICRQFRYQNAGDCTMFHLLNWISPLPAPAFRDNLDPPKYGEQLFVKASQRHLHVR
ncbi:hypothetical protein HELRODRAFT_184229 [Helobdella robusta]|uniref:Uncharacterized protein n=1 Tax=Helobdella robusta TaxID=6412 RepID=T1FKT1_HELRO|nr:hypothetical protein HELRODRAFT_184229 [Helobdella robusta]ESO04821.1 hypothetical protein HELRODRAFT_184229 [Helobdella robusta]